MNPGPGQSVRRHVHWKCYFKCGTGPVSLGHLLEVSPVGALLESPVKLVPGTELVLKLDAVHKGRTLDFTTKAVVRNVAMRHELFELGLQFRDLDESASKLLQAFARGQL
ncbi:MAG: PilZ domain-containing protein [Gammaproteobacteria bacterium]|nr:PilZ domain-containing protein [Gammaproteobacteria bacterium]